jgi:hypothetical protein
MFSFIGNSWSDQDAGLDLVVVTMPQALLVLG